MQQVVLELGSLRRAVCLAEVRGVEGMVLVAMEGRHTVDVSVTSLEDWCPCYTKVGVLTLTQLQYGSVGQNKKEAVKASRKDRSEVILDSTQRRITDRLGCLCPVVGQRSEDVRGWRDLSPSWPARLSS